MANKPKAEPTILTRDALLTSSGKTETYVIPELGGAVVLRPLTRQEQKDIATKSKVDEKHDEMRAEGLMIVLACVDPVLKPEDVDAFRAQDAGIVDRLVTRINTLSGFGRAAVEAARANFRA